MSYTCELCNYNTNDSGNYSHHKKTKKHLQNITKKVFIDDKTTTTVIKSVSKVIPELSTSVQQLSCPFCNISFTQKSNLSRHKKKCIIDNNNIILKEKELIEKELNLKLEYERKEKEQERREKELYQKLEKEKTELLNNFMNSANKIINKEQDNNKVTTDALKTVSISAIKYANEKFKNAPALLPIQNFNINNLDFNNEEDKKQLVEILIYNAKQKSLDKLLGDHIVKQYKKEKPEDQMFHTTDCSRLNYIVRQLMENALIWSVDKSGIEICSSIIKPLIKKCIDTLLEHQKYLLTEMGNGDLSKQTDVELIISILMSIDSGLLETEINKYIAPYFNLDKKINFI